VEAKVEFNFDTGGPKNKISTTIYGNDYSPVVTEINNLTASTGSFGECIEGKQNYACKAQ
jgi:hypothetical protein